MQKERTAMFPTEEDLMQHDREHLHHVAIPRLDLVRDKEDIRTVCKKVDQTMQWQDRFRREGSHNAIPPIPRLMNAAADERQCGIRRDFYTASLPFEELQRQMPSLQHSQEASSANFDSSIPDHHQQYEIWAKETENQAVRHSLANLQQHLSLVTAQKQNQGVTHKEEASSIPVDVQPSLRQGNGSDREQSSRAKQRFAPSNSFPQQIPGGYRARNSPMDSPFMTAMTSPAKLAPNRLHTSQMMQRQQQISQEARQLEQRHLDSFARAMDQSALKQSTQLYQGVSQEQYRDVLRLHAAMAGEWSDREGTAYMDVLNQNQWARPPTITLTEPSVLANRMQYMPDETIRGKMAWSDEPAHLYEEALSHQAQLSWQAAIAHAATSSHTSSTIPWSHLATAQSAVNGRRESVQSTLSQPMESERPFQSNDAAPSTNYPRRGSMNSFRGKKPFYPAQRRKGKQRDESLQRANDAVEMQSTNAPQSLPSVSAVSRPAERQILEQQSRNLPYSPNIISEERLQRCGTGPLNLTTIPTHTQRKQKRP